jgi:quinol monooxygenase YgiN
MKERPRGARSTPSGDTVVRTEKTDDDAHLTRAEFTAHDGRREAFIHVTKALASAAASEPGALRYDWFQDADPDKFVVLEEYVDAAAAFAHNKFCEQLLADAFELAGLTTLQLHGDITAELQTFADSLPIAKTYRPLT